MSSPKWSLCTSLACCSWAKKGLAQRTILQVSKQENFALSIILFLSFVFSYAIYCHWLNAAGTPKQHWLIVFCLGNISFLKFIIAKQIHQQGRWWTSFVFNATFILLPFEPHFFHHSHSSKTLRLQIKLYAGEELVVMLVDNVTMDGHTLHRNIARIPLMLMQWPFYNGFRWTSEKYTTSKE
jgi:hypothetical protein